MKAGPEGFVESRTAMTSAYVATSTQSEPLLLRLLVRHCAWVR
jgi:hypothetical protein